MKHDRPRYGAWLHSGASGPRWPATRSAAQRAKSGCSYMSTSRRLGSMESLNRLLVDWRKVGSLRQRSNGSSTATPPQRLTADLFRPGTRQDPRPEQLSEQGLPAARDQKGPVRQNGPSARGSLLAGGAVLRRSPLPDSSDSSRFHSPPASYFFRVCRASSDWETGWPWCLVLA